ncbi:hypothetical protein SAMN05216184_10958 [Georgenia satyanarayanai]|uniref:PGAP1-like protein n=1 Tax=Georgenia satyanarayanai TaxID=860221 RepID=A0A2Y9AL20_9MICO|nr:hypothetical protein [Georgenia satyanarayanai]PYF99036.1 hypothetical protein A8987_10958 [Georgenia satyanarayanai]SSA43998.1 hypothetical protein SAMN05216184_10958 [Georgenia satyanarayanai]
MTALLHSHDADGAAADARRRTSVHVRGGVGATRVDVEELRAIDALLDGLRGEVGHLESALTAARRDLALDASWSPALAAAAQSAVEDALDGGWGVRRLGDEVLELLLSLRYARLLYEEAELAARAQAPGPSWTGFLRMLLVPHEAVFAVADRLTLVGRLPGMEPTSTLGRAADALAEIVNLVHGDDDLPPDGIALDVAVRELGEHGQNVVPWFLAPRPFSYDGREIDPATLTGAQRLVIPVVTAFHSLTGRRPRSADDLTLTVSRPSEVSPAPDLPAVVDSLHSVHQDHGAVPGTLEVRRVDHADGTRSWTLLLPSTQAMAPGSRNPVDNLTNVETYAGLVSDVEIGAAEALRLAGVRPGEAVAVVGFSQGGLVAMRLAADPLVRMRYSITTVVTAGSPVGHLPTPVGTEVLHLEHLEDPFVGLDGTSNPAEEGRTTVSRSLATGTTGVTRLEVPPTDSHSIAEYARTAHLALEAEERSVTHLSERLADVSGRPGDRVTATRFTLERG